MRITEKLIAKLERPETGNAITFDPEVPGFGVRVTANGIISFILNYRFRSRQRRYTIGRFPELTATAARARAVQLRGRIADGHDPLLEREQAQTEPTVADLAKQYLERYGSVHKRLSSLRNDKYMLTGIIVPRIGDLRVGAINRRDIESLHATLKSTPYQANRVLSLLSKMFSLAVEWGCRADHPCKGIPRFHEDKRERWLTTEELGKFKAALDAYEDQNAADALRLLLLTGAREGEVLKADWTQFDVKRGIWTKPSHHVKQARTEHIPLSTAAIDLLRSMKPKKAGALFPGADGEKSRSTLRRPWLQACKAAGLTEATPVQGKRRKRIKYRPTVRLHDLRHSYASHLVSNGMSLHIVGKLLGHTRPETTARYAHIADSALRDATNVFGEIMKNAGKGGDE